MDNTLDAEYGRALSPADVVLDVPAMPQAAAAAQQPADLGNALWVYQKQGLINGVPVEDSAKGLSISSDDELRAAFMLDRRLRCLVLRLYDGDCPDKLKYDELLDKAHAGSLSIVSEDTHFDETRGQFLIVVKFEELQYKLHPRYAFMKE